MVRSRLQATRSDRAAASARRREVERHLAGLGLSWGPHRLAADAAPPHFDGSPGHRLRLALERLGPVFTAFGAFLGSRPDLLPVAVCRELQGLDRRGAPLAPAVVQALIEEETGLAVGELFAEWEAAPLAARLAVEVHRARLRDGTPVRVHIVPPDLEALMARDLPLLPLLSNALPAGERPLALAEAVEDFRGSIAARRDLGAEAESLERLGREVARVGSMRLPRVAGGIATARLLGLEELAGEELAGVIAGRPAGNPAELTDLARRIGLAWLHQALVAGTFPVELDPRDLLVLPDGSLALRALGEAATLAPPSRERLREYLIAAAGEDPEAASSHLLAEMAPGMPVAVEAELRLQLRQLVPFRDGGWGELTDGGDLAEQLFLHWRLAAAKGYRAPRHLSSFYRGLFAAAMAVRLLAPPDRDPLREALDNLRLLLAVRQLGRAAEPARLRRSLDAYTATLLDLPMTLDAALSQVAEGRPRLRLEIDPAARPPRRGAAQAAVALALALGAVVLLTRALTPALGAAAEAAGAALFVAVGALLLRILARA